MQKSSKDFRFEDEPLREYGGRLAEVMRTAQEAERHIRVGLQDRSLARLACPPVAVAPQLEVPWWAYALGPIRAETLSLRDPRKQPENHRAWLLLSHVSEAWHRWARNGYSSLLEMGPPEHYRWLLFPHVVRVALALWLKQGSELSLLVEYDPPLDHGQPATFRLPGQLVPSTETVQMTGGRLLARCKQRRMLEDETFLWSEPSSEGITTLRIDRVVDAADTTSWIPEGRTWFFLARCDWKEFMARRKCFLRPLITKKLDPVNVEVSVQIADDVRNALRSAPKD